VPIPLSGRATRNEVTRVQIRLLDFIRNHRAPTGPECASGGTNLWRGSNEASPNNGECQPGERVRVAASTNHGKRTRYGRAIELVGHGAES
jgi:hypothetical protein